MFCANKNKKPDFCSWHSKKYVMLLTFKALHQAVYIYGNLFNVNQYLVLCHKGIDQTWQTTVCCYITKAGRQFSLTHRNPALPPPLFCMWQDLLPLFCAKPAMVFTVQNAVSQRLNPQFARRVQTIGFQFISKKLRTLDHTKGCLASCFPQSPEWLTSKGIWRLKLSPFFSITWYPEVYCF